MKLWHELGASALLSAIAAVVAPQAASAQSVIKIDGSSTVFPIAEAVAEEFQIRKRGKVRVTVGIAGTGGGFKNFCRGETDISERLAPHPRRKRWRPAAPRASSTIELPVAFDALTVVVNPAEHLGQDADRRADLQEDVGAGRAGPRHEVEPGPFRLARDRTLMLFGPGADSGHVSTISPRP